jgi:CubicO group peptidase (beta-lactamase class C family)
MTLPKTLTRRALRLRLTSLLLVCLGAASASARQTPKQVNFEELERVVREELTETKTPGAAVAVISGGRVVFAKGFGAGNVETDATITPDTLFRLGSTTKMFTGAAMLALAEQGKVKLDAPVGDYARGLAPRLSRLTAHQLLSNTAGVGDFAAPFVSNDDSALSTMARGWKDDVLFADAGKIYSYSSPGFWLAGYVIEEAGGKPYADVMEERLFKPLGMTRTTFRPLSAMTHPLALGHNVQDGKPFVIRPFFNNVAMWPAGSIFSSVNDLSRFVIALMSGGRLDGAQVLPASLFKSLSGEYVSMPGEPSVHYGYGVLNFKQRGVRLVMHGGFSRGYGSMIQMAPEHGFAVIVLANRSGETLRRTTEKAKEMFLPLEPETAHAEEAKKPLPLTGEDLSGFVGKYVNGPQTWEITSKGGRLYLKAEDSEAALTKTGETRLSFGDALENDVILVRGPDGKAEYIFTGLYSGRKKP